MINIYTGTQKRAVVLKNADNKLFEAAYFILRDDETKLMESEIISEANKIIANNIPVGYFSDLDQSRQKKSKTAAVWFLSGALTSCFICFLLFMCIK